MGGVKVVAASIDGADAKSLRETVDKLKDRLKSANIYQIYAYLHSQRGRGPLCDRAEGAAFARYSCM